MKRITALFIMMALTKISFGQSMLIMQAGAGVATRYTSTAAPTVECMYLRRVRPMLNYGYSLSYQRYSVTDNIRNANPADGAILSIKQRSNYLFVSPVLDLRTGKNDFLHANVCLGPGLLINGNQQTNRYDSVATAVGGNSERPDFLSSNTSNTIIRIVFRFGVGIAEHIATKGRWDILCSQNFSILATDISQGGPGGYNLHTNYVAFQLGIIRKYPLSKTAGRLRQHKEGKPEKKN